MISKPCFVCTQLTSEQKTELREREDAVLFQEDCKKLWTTILEAEYKERPEETRAL